jgi:hypothetical protein
MTEQLPPTDPIEDPEVIEDDVPEADTVPIWDDTEEQTGAPGETLEGNG